MNNIILFDDNTRHQLLPLTFTRPVATTRVGILTIAEKWKKWLNGDKISYKTEPYLQGKFPAIFSKENVLINGGLLPDATLVSAIKNLQLGEALYKEEVLLAARIKEEKYLQWEAGDYTFLKKEYTNEVGKITRPWHIFQLNGQEIAIDFQLLTKGRTSQLISPTNTVIGQENIFLEEGAKVECSILNASTGPIYIGKDAEIMEGCIVRGPLAMWEKSVLKIGAKIYGPTTLGTYCKVGGEVNNVVFTAYAAKAHEGFVGNSVIGEWCNIGADSNTSNLKNNYAKVRLWDYTTQRFGDTGLQFCGLIMGDHAKCGINTMFNTGTVVGVTANVYGAGYPRNFVPSFAWGGAQGFKTFRMNKVIEVAERVMARRGKTLMQEDIDIFQHIFEMTAKHRRWEQ